MRFKDYDAAVSDDGGTITGYASTFDRDPDSYGDVVAPGAFSDTLKAWEASGHPIPLLFGHRTDDPFMNIGAVTSAEEDEKGLRFTAEFDPESETAQYCRRLALQGRCVKFSFAFDVLDEGTVTLEDGRKANELRKLDLFEISLVPIPANHHAGLEDVKAGRVISRRNADALQAVREDMQSALDGIDGLIAQADAMTDDGNDEANEEEPKTANSDEQKSAPTEVELYMRTLNQKGAYDHD